jgi:ABC-type nitrate/sulfonate/bicarbonate transport system ATPase subunit
MRLMDEPFSAWGENTRERLQEKLIRLWETGGQTVVS